MSVKEEETSIEERLAKLKIAEPLETNARQVESDPVEANGVGEVKSVTAVTRDSAATLLVHDKLFTLHEDNEPHPERPDRVRAILRLLKEKGIKDRCRRMPIRPATDEELLRVHTQSHIDRVETSWDKRGEDFDFNGDTYCNRFSAKSARAAAGSTVQLCFDIAEGKARNGLALVRPPGHHACANAVMGFCLYNNVAVAAAYLRDVLGLERVAIVDWDVHHGNGTEEMFEREPKVLYLSIHRHDNGSFYPGTGFTHQVGEDAGRGFNVNIPWNSRGRTDADYELAFLAIVRPVLTSYKPQFIIVSSGFDCAKGDPLGGMKVTPVGFSRMTSHLLQICPKVAVILEGGYNLDAISEAAVACAEVLLGGPAAVLDQTASDEARLDLTAAVSVLKEHWPVLDLEKAGEHCQVI